MKNAEGGGGGGLGRARNGARTAQRTVPTKKLFSLNLSGLQPISKAPGQRHLSRWTGAGEGKGRRQNEECRRGRSSWGREAG